MKKPNSPINDQINVAHKNDKPKAQLQNEGAKRKKERNKGNRNDKTTFGLPGQWNESSSFSSCVWYRV